MSPADTPGSGLAEQLADALSEADLPPTAAVVAAPPDPGSQPPPEGVWAVVPFDGRYVVGAVGRGQFVDYEAVASFDEAVALVVRLVGEPAAQLPVEDAEDLRERGRRTSATVLDRTRTRGGAAGTALLEPGDAVDLVGPETAHHLYALGTPFPERSQPPTDVGAAYHRYLLLRPLPDATEGVCAPWFGQPGGGAMVVLQHPVRWYVDEGCLVELVESADPDAAR